LQHFFSFIMLISPIVFLLWLVYRENFQDRRSLSVWDKVRGMRFYIGMFVGLPVLMFTIYLVFDIDTCQTPGLSRWRNC